MMDGQLHVWRFIISCRMDILLVICIKCIQSSNPMIFLHISGYIFDRYKTSGCRSLSDVDPNTQIRQSANSLYGHSLMAIKLQPHLCICTYILQHRSHRPIYEQDKYTRGLLGSSFQLVYLVYRWFICSFGFQSSGTSECIPRLLVISILRYRFHHSIRQFVLL